MPKQTLYLLHYNNYYNRIVKYSPLLSDYEEYIEDSLTQTNFNPGDEITTSHVISWTKTGDPDYLLVVDENGNIESRWFIMTMNRLMKNQYQLALQRDVMADYYNDILSSTCYIEKANIPSDDDMIFNSEGIQFNQIKQSETKLYDKTKTPWIVGYVASNSITDNQFNKVHTINFQTGDIPLDNYDQLLEWQSNPPQILKGDPTYITKVAYSYKSGLSYKNKYYTFETTPGQSASNYGDKKDGSSNIGMGSDIPQTAAIELAQAFTTNKLSLQSKVLAGFNLNATDTFNNYNNRIVRDPTTGYTYQISISYRDKSSVEQGINYTGTGSVPAEYQGIYDEIKRVINTCPTVHMSNTSAPNTIAIRYNTSEVIVSLTRVEYGDISIDLSSTVGRPILNDSPYYMFAMPYNDENLQLAIQLKIDSQSFILDIQVLPYCPVQDYYDNTGVLHLPTQTGYYVPIKYKDTIGSYLFWCTKSRGTFDIPYQIDITDYKISNECDTYRLCSPNGNGQFEFSAAMNRGVTKFNVDWYYRPIDPYIHMNPDFNGLYGNDFDDFRGLILNGDFSIPEMNDQWTNYQIQNKNYQNIFDREVQNLRINQKMQRIQNIVGAITGAGTGAISGAAGSSFIPGISTGVGAAIGGSLSLAGGIADIFIGERMMREQREFKEDMYNYQIGNIQAIPQSVAKTGCLVNNNKLVPYLEYYSCTETEKQLLRNMIKYNGMTVGRIGKISEYSSNGQSPCPVQAMLIEIEARLDTHVVQEINNRLQAGIRYDQQNIFDEEVA